MTGAEEIFAPDGPLARTLDNYEPREAQVEMARAVELCIDGGGVILAEAGTGTGKTLAYLVPAILSGRKVVVSTGTRNLQEQIYFKDIALLERALGTSISAAYLKGQDNYLCRRRLEQFLGSPAVLNHPPREVARLEEWARKTVEGDRMELTNLSDSSPLWNQVCSTRETRIGVRCPFHSDCHVTRARARANSANLLVVNHHLYFADLATRMLGGSVLPAHEVVIFDEAHLIEDVATEFFSIKVSSGRIDRLVDESIASVRGARLSDDPHEGRRDAICRNAKRDSSDLFAAASGEGQGRTHLPAGQLPEQLVAAYHRLDSSLESLQMSLRVLEGRDEGIDHCSRRIEQVRDDLGAIIEGSRRGFVYWVEARARTSVLGASPIDISRSFREGVLFFVPSVVLTSATLSTSNNFDFLRSRLGIDFDAVELSLEAPFDYQEQACLYIPHDLPDPRDDGFSSAAALEIGRLVELFGGGALILCTSVKSMRAIHELISLDHSGQVLLQGEAPKSVLVRKFLDDHSSVLVATTSFWQGVDLPGEALRLVVIDKLPFASPYDPVVAARIDHCREQGKAPFMDYQVPQAALALKQGFGRLIRTRHDRGVVAILDNRLVKMRYSGAFLRSLPGCPRTGSFDEVRRWWGEIS